MKKFVLGLMVAAAVMLLAPSVFAISYVETIPSVVRLDVVDSNDDYFWGTGFFISSDSFILTNAHVIMDENTGLPADYIDICTIADEYSSPVCEYSGQVLAYDVDIDLALVVPAYAIDETGNEVGEYVGAVDLGYSYVDLADLNPDIGDDLTIFGFPDASLMSTITLTEGIVSGFISLDADWIWQITTDATINPGNSGGPAHNWDERVVGIVTEVSTGGIGGNYGYIISNDIIYLWFLDLVEQDILNEQFVLDLFSNDYAGGADIVPIDNLETEVFTDVDLTTANAVAISYLKGEGVISGYHDGSFGPFKSLNRAELLKILVEGVGHSPDAATYKSCFPDVAEEWFAKYVCFAKAKGWVSGYPDGTFQPARNVNKVEAVKMLLEVFGVELMHEPGDVYNDVTDGEWFTDYVGTALVMGLLEEEGNFYRPSSDITRAGVSENIYRLLTM